MDGKLEGKIQSWLFSLNNHAWLTRYYWSRNVRRRPTLDARQHTHAICALTNPGDAFKRNSRETCYFRLQWEILELLTAEESDETRKKGVKAKVPVCRGKSVLNY